MKTFKIPQSITIASREIPVLQDATLDKRLAEESHLGESTDGPNPEIRLQSILLQNEKQITFIHEVMHHCNYIFRTDLEEEVIKKLAFGIHEVIQQLEPLP